MKTKYSRIVSCWLAAWVLAVAPVASLAQVVINSPPTVIPDHFILYAGEVLNVGPGGEVGHGFNANDGSVVTPRKSASQSTSVWPTEGIFAVCLDASA
jgi:hypothetical protein